MHRRHRSACQTPETCLHNLVAQRPALCKRSTPHRHADGAEPKQFLGLNVDAPDGPDGAVCVSVRAYLEKLAEELLPKPLSEYPPLSTPCRPGLLEAYEKAKELKQSPSPEALKRYQTKLGKGLYASSAGTRPDLAYAIAVCARCATYPTEDMEKCLDYAIVYLSLIHISEPTRPY